MSETYDPMRHAGSLTAEHTGLPFDGKPVRRVVDASALPSYAFGHRGTLWWGNAGFALIEGFTLFLCAAAYFYVRRNFEAWPPPPTPPPDLLVPTANLVLMLVALAPAWYVVRAAKRLELGGVRLGLIALLALEAVVLVLRWYEFKALNTRWDSHAYGSDAWATMGFHSTLIILDFGESIGWLLLAFSSRLMEKHFPDYCENSYYWSFVVGSWVPLYVMLFLFPRWV